MTVTARTETSRDDGEESGERVEESTTYLEEDAILPSRSIVAGHVFRKTGELVTN